MPAHMRSDMSTGERIAAWRIYRGLTQEACAGLVGRSLSWWKKVEAGTRHVERLVDLIQIGQVLRVENLAELTGESRFSLAMDGRPEHVAIPAVKTAFNTLRRPGAARPDHAALRRTVATGWNLWHTSPYFHSRVGDLVPGLVRDAETLLRGCPDDELRDAHRLRADAYQLVRGWLRKVCAYDLARIAAERGMQSALRADDPARVGLAAFGLTGVLMAQRPEAGLTVSIDAIRMLEDHLGTDTAEQQECLAVWGSLNLSASVAAARSGEDGPAEDFLGRAATASESLGVQYVHPTTVFGRANIAAYAVAVPVELGHSAAAVSDAERGFDPTSLPSVERRARSLIDVARGHAARREDAEAMRCFELALRESPEEVQNCVVAHSVIHEMLRRDKRANSRELRTLARRVGVLEAV